MWRATRHSLPFMSLPVMLTINTLLNNFNILVYFTTKAGIYTTIIPREIMTGETLNYKRHLEIPLGNIAKYTKNRPLATAQDFVPGVLFAWVPEKTSLVDSNYDLSINEKGGKSNLRCNPKAWHRGCASERTRSEATQWSRLPWSQEASNRRAWDHRSGCWVNWRPTTLSNRTRYWYRSYIGRRRNTTITSGTSRHAHYWTRTRYRHCKRGWNPGVIGANNWSSCFIISGSITIGDHISCQDFLPWGNTSSAPIFSINISKQAILHPKYVRQSVWNCKYPIAMQIYFVSNFLHDFLPRTDWGIVWRGSINYDAVIPQGRHEVL